MQFILSLYRKHGLSLRNYSSYLKVLSRMCYAANLYILVADYDGSVKKYTVYIDKEENKVGKIRKNGLELNIDKYA